MFNRASNPNSSVCRMQQSFLHRVLPLVLYISYRTVSYRMFFRLPALSGLVVDPPCPSSPCIIPVSYFSGTISLSFASSKRAPSISTQLILLPGLATVLMMSSSENASFLMSSSTVFVSKSTLTSWTLSGFVAVDEVVSQVCFFDTGRNGQIGIARRRGARVA